ncbi:MAG TPA: PfkB family carbohydrate kinase [Pirellulaceae bacterium]|nr:PfkB family carbohydrate kinase [Pirellulaceae bacterium]
MITHERLESILGSLPRLTIGLVGDLFLDRYLEIEPVEELSIETGLEAYQVAKVRNSPGALGTVLNNLAALGVGLLVPVTVIGDDGHGYDLLKEVRKLPVDPTQIICSPRRLTPTYTKPLKPDASGMPRELNRIDVRTRQALSDDETRLLGERITQVFHSSDGLIVLDQIVAPEQGVINVMVRSLLCDLAEQHPEKLIFVDSRANLQKFQRGTLKGNLSEIAGRVDDDENPVAAATCAAAALSRKTGCPAFCTLGDRGILVTRPGDEPTLVPGVRIAGSVDIVGAGDAATSGIVASLLAGADELEAATVGNLVASITVQQLGTTGTATPEQVRARRREAKG